MTERLAMNVTYYVVSRSIGMKRENSLPALPKRRLPRLRPNGEHARSQLQHAGAVAFSRTGDPSVGEFQDAVVLVQFGEVDLERAQRVRKFPARGSKRFS